jgi:hypothetical protein
MAGECDKPKKDDQPIKGSPKGDKGGKGDKGKNAKGKPDGGKGKPQINKVETEASTTVADRELTKKDSNTTEPEDEPGKQLDDLHKTVIKMLKEKERRDPMEELTMIVDTLKKSMDIKAKTIKIRKIKGNERRYGLIDSGATNNVREAKAKENLKGLVPNEVEVAFESEVKADLFMNCFGTIIGPEGTETIVSMHELIEAGYSRVWQTKTEVVLQKKEGIALPVEVHNGTPVLPNDMCLRLIEEFEMKKGAKIRQSRKGQR